MRETIRQELIQHVIDTIQDLELTDFDELHYHAFNENYYMVYHSQALEWLKRHDIDAFEAIGDILEWEEQTFGSTQLKGSDCNPAKVVNLYVYMLGEELLADYDLDQKPAELLADLRADLQEVAA